MCKSVIDINFSLKELKEMLQNLDTKYAIKLVEKIVFGFAALILWLHPEGFADDGDCFFLCYPILARAMDKV